MSGIENRKEPRAPIELRVEYRKLNTFFADYTKNISKGGTFIKTPNPLPIGTRLVFRLALPGLHEPFELAGEVTWSVGKDEAQKTGQDAGMGLRFVFDDAARRDAFEATVERLMVESLGPDIYRQLVGSRAG